MAQIRLPAYLKWRDGRPRWEPGPKLRGLGYKGRNLQDEAGRWLGLDAAMAAAAAINAAVEAGGGKRVRPTKGTRKARSCRQLYEMWIKSPEFGLLRESTRADYRMKVEVFLQTAIEGEDRFADIPVAALGRGILKRYWRECFEARGHSMANGVLAAVRAMLTHAVDLEWIELNPAFKLKLKGVAPRQVLWLPAEVAELVAAADRLGQVAIGDAIVVALHTGQRRGDVLALPARLFEGDRVRLSQLKGKARIDAPMTPQLKARVLAIRARRAGDRVVDLNGPLIRDEHGEPFTKDSFKLPFRAVRAEAARTLPAIAGRTFQDLRDTAVTRLALADCNMAEIASITGHSIRSVTQIIKHYLVLQPEMADSAISKLSKWLEKEGIAL